MAVDTGVGARRGAEPQEEAWPPAIALEAAEAEETKAGLHRAVWMLAWPSVLTMLLQTLNSFTDRFFVGHLGSDALAAVGVGGQFMFLLFSVGMSVSVGTVRPGRPVYGGEGAGPGDIGRQPVRMDRSDRRALLSGRSRGRSRAHVIGWMGVDSHAAALCIRYLSLTLLGVPALFLMLILSSVFRGLGDTVTPLRVMIGVNVIHLGGDWLLIFGHWGFPRMGLPGGAVALIASQVVGAGLYLWFLRDSPVRGLLTRRLRLDLDWARRILNIGLPAAGQNLSRVLSMMTFTAVLARAPEATAAVAAFTIGLTSESIAFMPGFAFSMAASTLTGQNLGAGNPGRAERAAWTALLQGLAVMIFMGAVFFVFARPFAHIFTHDPHVVPLAVAYLRIAAVSEPFLALGMILTGALNGAGDTKAPAWAAVVTMWGVRLPLAWLGIFGLALGAVGAWWALTISTCLNGLIALWLFKRGRWKHTVV